jgi:hypothetical protein
MGVNRIQKKPSRRLREPQGNLDKPRPPWQKFSTSIVKNQGGEREILTGGLFLPRWSSEGYDVTVSNSDRTYAFVLSTIIMPPYLIGYDSRNY